MSATGDLDEFYEALLEDDAEALYERAPCGYLSTTPDGTIIKVNATFLSMTGYARDEVVGRREFAHLLSPGGRIYHETHYAPLLRMQGMAREIALEIVRADGTRLPVLVNSVLERGSDGTPRVVRTAVFDATERREYERELLRAKERAEESEERARLLARTLQQTLIPPHPPDVPGLDVAGGYRPAGTGDEVGGDFYDVFQVASDDWVVAIGDVRGKGVEAAVITALVRYTIRATAVREPQATLILDALNKVLLADTSDRFCTALIARLRRREGVWTAEVALGGHPPALLVDSRGTTSFVGEPRMLLGSFPDAEFTSTEVALHSGDVMVVYTDGVTEGRRGREFFGEGRLVDASLEARTTADDVVANVLREVVEFQDGHPRDDIALVAIRVP